MENHSITEPISDKNDGNPAYNRGLSLFMSLPWCSTLVLVAVCEPGFFLLYQKVPPHGNQHNGSQPKKHRTIFYGCQHQGWCAIMVQTASARCSTFVFITDTACSLRVHPAHCFESWYQLYQSQRKRQVEQKFSTCLVGYSQSNRTIYSAGKCFRNQSRPFRTVL